MPWRYPAGMDDYKRPIKGALITSFTCHGK